MHSNERFNDFEIVKIAFQTFIINYYLVTPLNGVVFVSNSNIHTPIDQIYAKNEYFYLFNNYGAIFRGVPIIDILTLS